MSDGKRYNVTLPPGLAMAVEKSAEQDGLSVAGAIRRAVRAYHDSIAAGGLGWKDYVLKTDREDDAS